MQGLSDRCGIGCIRLLVLTFERCCTFPQNHLRASRPAC
jgi:hypothetical protein